SSSPTASPTARGFSPRPANGRPARGRPHGERQDTWPMTWLEPVTLSSGRATLEPLAHKHCPDLIEAVADGELWRLWYTTVPAPERVAAELEHRLGLQAAG